LVISCYDLNLLSSSCLSLSFSVLGASSI
jgi:hypothetical protein